MAHIEPRDKVIFLDEERWYTCRSGRAARSQSQHMYSNNQVNNGSASFLPLKNIKQPLDVFVRMVHTTEIAESNARYAGEHHKGLVCVFAGGTAGIGAGTLERLSTMLQSSTFYILGRNPPRHAAWLDQLRASSPSNNFIFVEALVSLIADIDTACSQIRPVEQKVDILCSSSGGMPFAGAKCECSFLHPGHSYVELFGPRLFCLLQTRLKGSSNVSPSRTSHA